MFMAFAYLWWYVGAILAAASTGAFVATAFASIIGVTSGAALITFGLIGALAVALLAISVKLPVNVVIVNTAIAGGAIATAGLMLMFDVINRTNLEDGFGYAVAGGSWTWTLGWLAIAAVGIGMQMTMLRSVVLPSDPWAHAE